MKETLPKKDFFKANEVMNLLHVKPHDVGFWESEFPQIRPIKTKKGKKLYRKDDVIIFSSIKHLIYEKKFTIDAARRLIADSDELIDSISPEKELEVKADTTTGTEEAAQESEVKPVECVSSDAACAEASSDDESRETICAQTDIEDAGLAGDRALREASKHLAASDEEFDKRTKEIYLSCGDDLEKAVEETPAHYLGEMLGDALSQKSDAIGSQTNLLPEEYAKALVTLEASKKNLNELLLSLDKYKESDFWRGFK